MAWSIYTLCHRSDYQARPRRREGPHKSSTTSTLLEVSVNEHTDIDLQLHSHAIVIFLLHPTLHHISYLPFKPPHITITYLVLLQLSPAFSVCSPTHHLSAKKHYQYSLAPCHFHNRRRTEAHESLHEHHYHSTPSITVHCPASKSRRTI
jgi:hypothetical protein